MTSVLDGVLERLAELGARLLLAAAVLVAIMAVGRLVRPVVRARLRQRGRPSYTRVFTALYGVIVVVVGSLLAATVAFPSVQVVDVLASLGIVSVAVGFAFKDVLENLLAGVLLLLRDPFKSGDQVRVAGYEGVVEGVTVRETLLRTFDGRRVLIPNATVYTNPLEVHTHFTVARSAFTVLVADDQDTDAVCRAARQALQDEPLVLDDPAPEVLVVDWPPGGILVECRLWSPSLRADRTRATHAAISAVRRALAAQGARLPQEHLSVEVVRGPGAEEQAASDRP